MADGSTWIEYGNLRLYRVVTRELHQEQVLDESGTDLLFFRTKIRVSGFMHGHLIGQAGSVDGQNVPYYKFPGQLPANNGVSGSASSAHQAFRWQLPPRQTFRMVLGDPNPGDVETEGGRTLFLVNPAPVTMNPPPNNGTNPINLSGVDVCNGPFCRDFAVTQLTGDELFYVEASFEFCQVWCDANGTAIYNSYGVLNNRWSTIDSIGPDLRTTRTYTGVVTLASANINAQQLRWITAPPLQPLFRRDHMEFKVQPDGLKLHYTITDQEIHQSAPYPARKWSAVHTERIGLSTAQMVTSSINVELLGDTSTNKKDLIQLGFYIISSKLWNATPNNVNAAGVTVMINDFETIDFMGEENRVVMRCNITRQAAAENVDIVTDPTLAGAIPRAIIAAAFQRIGTPLNPVLLPAPNNGAGGVDGNGIPFGAGLGGVNDTGGSLVYNPTVSWGAYAGQIAKVEGPAKIVGIFACFLQNPCNDFHSVTTPSTTIPSQNTGSLSNNPQTTASASLSSQISQLPVPIYSVSHQTNTYLFWRIERVWLKDTLQVQMPIAGAPQTIYSPTSAMIGLAGTQARTRIIVHAERMGADPEFPDLNGLPLWPYPSPIPSGYIPITMTGLKSRLVVRNPHQTMAIGAELRSAIFEAIIALSRAPIPGIESLPIGTDKWNNVGQQVAGSDLTNANWNASP